MKTLFFSTIFATALTVSLAAKADSYILFPDSALYCVNSSNNYSLVTIEPNGSHTNRTIKQFKHTINSGKKKVSNARETLKNRLKNASASKKPGIRAKIADATLAIKIFNSAINFAKSCGAGALEGQAIQGVLPTRPTYNPGTKK